ncbi:MAG: hypothetical protein J7639_24725 [Paenibacillaceae bacterium]|nr:hypothetical protein [Paenibacillaceae bacterium]
MHEIKMIAGSIISYEKLRLMDEAGLTVIPKAILEQLRNCQDEDVMILAGKAIVIRAASPGDVERISNSNACMD